MLSSTPLKKVKFDLKFEKERKRGLRPPDAECGDDKRAPYQKEHLAATTLERLMTSELNIDWATYSKPLRAKETQRVQHKTSTTTLRARHHSNSYEQFCLFFQKDLLMKFTKAICEVKNVLVGNSLAYGEVERGQLPLPEGRGLHREEQGKLVD